MGQLQQMPIDVDVNGLFGEIVSQMDANSSGNSATAAAAATANVAESVPRRVKAFDKITTAISVRFPQLSGNDISRYIMEVKKGRAEGLKGLDAEFFINYIASKIEGGK